MAPVKRGIGQGDYLSGPAPLEYLIGPAAPTWRMRPLMTNLMRVHDHVTVAIAIVPYSQALVELSVKENTPEPKREQELQERSTYYKDETCFIVEAATRSESTARFNRWTGTAQNAGGTPQRLIFKAGTFLKDLPVQSRKYFPRYEWENSTLACTEKLDLSRPFKVGIVVPGPGDDDEPADPVIFGWN
ncbi:MAG TPA: hypothetical protein VFV50_17060 [Bdellovibrionales bacterium]|nr:hypothetical protein [Bdellovibrionales bacterium]